MALRNTLSFGRALVATNLKASFALRRAFWVQVVFMAANNAIFFSVWWIFFSRFDSIAGWRLADMAAIFGLVATAFGLAVVFAGGLTDLSRHIVEGDLDPLLTQPKNVLLHAVGSRTYASGWGDIASGLLFIALSGLVHPHGLPLVFVALACSTTVFVATGVLLHSLAFWLGRVETLVRQLWEFLITFSLYPRPLFSGALQVLLFTLIPAGFIGHLPVQLLRDFTWTALAAALAGAAFYAALASGVFALGLRRYESGNRFGVRA